MKAHTSENTLEAKILKLLVEDPGKNVKELAKQIKVNRSFAACRLQALEGQGYVRFKGIWPAKSISIERS